MEQKYTDVAARIQSRLKILGLKQIDICNETGLSTTTVSQYCTGKRLPESSILPRLSAVLKTSIEWILTGEDMSNEDLTCDGASLSADEADLIAIYRLLPEAHQRELFELACFKYHREVEQGKDSIYSTYGRGSARQRSGPGEEDDTVTETA